MNSPDYSVPDSGVPRTETDFLFDDWDLSEEKSPLGGATLFDGKIIARMPDLGSTSIVKSIEKPKFPSFWGKIGMSVFSVFHGRKSAGVAAGQQFFHRVTTFGGILLLIGVGVLLFDHGVFDQGKEGETDNAALAEIFAGNAESATASFAAVPESAFSSIMPPQSGNAMSAIASGSAIPVAPVESVAAVSPASPWDRPAADSHTSWDAAQSQSVQSQPDNLFLPIEVAVANPVPPVSPTTVTMSPMTPITAPVVATPAVSTPIVSPVSPPVSPHEIQLLAQSNAPPHIASSVSHPSVGTPFPPSHPSVPLGVMPMQERLQYMSNTAPQHSAPNAAPQHSVPNTVSQQIPPWHPSAQQQQFPPSVHGQQAVPMNNPHGQFGQNSQYVVPPSYMLSQSQRAHGQAAPQNTPMHSVAPHNVAPQYTQFPGIVPQNSPIPSAASTLPVQGGSPPPSHGVPMHGIPTQGVPAHGAPMHGVPAHGVPTQGVPTQGAPNNSNSSPNASQAPWWL